MMMKNTITFTLAMLFVFSTNAFSQKIYQWEEQGVDNYSNNPAEVPYEKLYEDHKNSEAYKSQEQQALAELANTLDGPAKDKLQLMLEAESKLEKIIAAKKQALSNLKKQKEPPILKVVDLENYILKAEHNLKVIRAEKDQFIKQNQRS